MSDIREALYAKIGGFMKGICNPVGGYDLLHDLGIGWIRYGVPYPFNSDGSVNEYYLRFLDETRAYAENGIRSVLTTPYPCAFIENGVDPRTPDGLRRVHEVCAFLARDFRGLGVCWQATNELFAVNFRMPLDVPESVEFLVACLQGLREGDPDAAIGHNTVTLADGWDEYCRDIDRRTDCDYFGFDLYIGSWDSGTLADYEKRIEELYELCRKPIILMEFGFASTGGNAHADRREELEFLRANGFSSPDEIDRRPQDFVKILPPRLKNIAETCVPEDLVPTLRGMRTHLTKLWYTDMLYPHTEEGQARFYAELLPRLFENTHLAGAVLYCVRDSSTCYICGANDCPCETAWGLTRCDDSPKPAYDVVKRMFCD